MEIHNADLSSLKIKRDSGGGSSNSGLGRKILVGVGVAAVVLVIYFILKNLLFSSTAEVKVTSAVLTSSSQNNAVLVANGYIVAQRKAAVASKGTGRLMYLGVVEGDKVYKDQVIARLEDNDIKAQLDQATANLSLIQSELKDAENSYNRMRALVQSKSASQADLDAAEYRYKRVLANIEVAKAQVRAAQVAMENMLIRAPFNGTVLTKNADVGEIVAPYAASASSKAAVVTIADMTSLQVEADVSESNIDRISIQQECEISLDAYPDRKYQGYVDKIVPTADRSKATVLVKVGIKNYDARVLPEMSAKVMFISKDTKMSDLNEPPILTIPNECLIQKDNKTFVYIVKNEKVSLKEIKTGQKFSAYTEVKDGLTTAEKIVVSPSAQLNDNQKVKVTE